MKLFLCHGTMHLSAASKKVRCVEARLLKLIFYGNLTNFLCTSKCKISPSLLLLLLLLFVWNCCLHAFIYFAKGNFGAVMLNCEFVCWRWDWHIDVCVCMCMCMFSCIDCPEERVYKRIHKSGNVLAFSNIETIQETY